LSGSCSPKCPVINSQKESPEKAVSVTSARADAIAFLGANETAREFTNPGTELPVLHDIMESDVHDEREQADKPNRIVLDADNVPQRNPFKITRALPETGVFETFNVLEIKGPLSCNKNNNDSMKRFRKTVTTTFNVDDLPVAIFI
jgi:hypothetical protein